MLFFSRFTRLSGQKTAPVHRASVVALLRAALAHHVCVEVLFTDRNRQMDNVYCRIMALQDKSLRLMSTTKFLPDALNSN